MWTPPPEDGDEEQHGHGRDCTSECRHRARQQAQLTGPRAVPCPWCNAGLGEPCTKGRGVLLHGFHPSRQAAAA